MNKTIFALLALFTSTNSFSPPVARHILQWSRRTPNPLHAEGKSEDNENADGGTQWIKDAMGQENQPQESPSPSSKKDEQFSKSEIQEMEELIVSLSKESIDEKRREKLNGILDKELIAQPAADGDSSPAMNTELPKFAKLFQLALDSVGENVQNAAREKAMARQESTNGAENKPEKEGGDIIGQLKSEEELQLWALIDMMVQSKTRVKMFMGTLGSKGEFR